MAKRLLLRGLPRTLEMPLPPRLSRFSDDFRHVSRAGIVQNRLRDVLANNPIFKVVIAHGMTDLVTPYLTSRYVVDRLPQTLTAGRVTLNVYPGGHMMYLRPGSRARLHADAAWLYSALP